MLVCKAFASRLKSSPGFQPKWYSKVTPADGSRPFKGLRDFKHWFASRLVRYASATDWANALVTASICQVPFNSRQGAELHGVIHAVQDIQSSNAYGALVVAEVLLCWTAGAMYGVTH